MSEKALFLVWLPFHCPGCGRTAKEGYEPKEAAQMNSAPDLRCECGAWMVFNHAGGFRDTVKKLIKKAVRDEEKKKRHGLYR